MIIKQEFNNHDVEVTSYSFIVQDNQSIHFHIKEGPFEHCFIVIKDSNETIRGLLTLKTRVFDYTLTENIESTSNGLMYGTLPNGEWTIEIVKPALIKGKVEIAIDFDKEIQEEVVQDVLAQNQEGIFSEERKWYIGDFHAHTHYSDGRVSFHQVNDQIIKKQLDVVAITEHSMVTTVFKKQKQALIIPATEITLDNLGHYNIFGLKEFVDYASYFKCATKIEALKQMLQSTKNQGCITSLNHPFTIGRPVGDDVDINSFDLMEVINSPHLDPPEVDNEKAIQFFDYCWKRNYLLYGIGGSDSHKEKDGKPYPLGCPTTSFYSEGLSIQKVIEAMKMGRMFIYLEDRFSVKMKQGQIDVFPGQKVMGRVMINVSAEKDIDFYLIKNGEIDNQFFGKDYRVEVDVLPNDYYRIEARKNGDIIFFMNPIHCKENNENKVILTEIIQQFEGERK